MDVWKEIDNQKENAIKSDRKYKKFLEETLDDPHKRYFQESWEGRIPLEYHTEAVSKPVYHPLTISRVLIYLNPVGLKKYSDLKEYTLKWFGMTLESLRDYVKNGWVIIQLNAKDEYDKKSQDEINEFFRDLEAKPIYVYLVDDLLPSIIGYENKTLNEILSEEKKRVKNLHKRWSNIIKEPIEIGGVEIDADKVMENYVKLKFIKDVFENEGYKKTANGIKAEIDSLEKIENSKALALRAYTSFLIYGTPLLYCDGSGFVSVGPEPYWCIVQANTKRMFEKIKAKCKKVISSTWTNEKILYFDNIEKPHEIINRHYTAIKDMNEKEARGLEKKIKLMIKEVYGRCDNKGNYIEAFKSYENEASGAESRKITIPISFGSALVGWVIGGIIGALMGLTPLLTEVKPIKTIALKRVAGGKIFGVNIEEEEIPDLGIEIPEAYKDYRFRVFKIPVKKQDHASEEIKTAELPNKT